MDGRPWLISKRVTSALTALWLFADRGQIKESESGYYSPRNRSRQAFTLHEQAENEEQIDNRHHDTKPFSPAFLEKKSTGKQNKRYREQRNESAPRDGDHAGKRKEEQALAHEIAADINPLESTQESRSSLRDCQYSNNPEPN